MTHPYRTSPPRDLALPPPAPRAWKRPVCWVLGHDRGLMCEVTGRHRLDCPFGGCDAVCRRCGAPLALHLRKDFDRFVEHMLDCAAARMKELEQEEVRRERALDDIEERLDRIDRLYPKEKNT